jgi:filamentous hemagglutinin family protein
MKQPLFTLIPVGCCLGLFTATSAMAQITPDGSLPTNVEQQGNVAEITGGGRAGDNLFHSFKDFSVNTGQEAFFNNALDIQNILSRVTGGNISNIDGLIRANGTANLFLLNPMGIIFGNNARLDVGGSFLGSTADGLLFDDGTEFSAVNSSTPVLTINAPIGLNLRDTTGSISNTGILNVDRDLTLAAGNLDLQGQLTAGDNLTLEALDKLIINDSLESAFIAEAGGEISLQGDRSIDISVLNNRNSGLFAGGDLTLRSANPVSGDAYFESGGNFRIEGLDGNGGEFISLEDPVVRSQGDVSFQSYQGASLHIFAGGSVEVAGDIRITGTDDTVNSIRERVSYGDNRTINIDGSSIPTLDVRAGVADVGEVGISGNFNPNTSNNATGSQIDIGGTIFNPGGTVFLTNQYRPNNNLAAGSITVGGIDTSNPLGDGGEIAIDSRGSINILGEIDSSSIANARLTTVAGLASFPQVTIEAGEGGAVSLIAGDNITAEDFNTASQLNLELNTAVDTISEANSIGAIPQALVRAGGGGEVVIAADDININNINSSSQIALTADSVANDNFSIIAALLEIDAGDAGNITLDAGNNLTVNNLNSSLRVSDRINSNTTTTPNITLAVSDVDLIIPKTNIGSGGNITLTAGDRLSAGNLDTFISLINNVDNSASIEANNPNASSPNRPARAFSNVTVDYRDVTIGSSGNITLAAERATAGDVNSSLSVISDNTGFAEARVSNDASARAFSDNTINLRAIAGSPGEVTFEVNDSFNIGNLNSAATNRGTNNTDDVAFSDNPNQEAFARAESTGTNTVFFDPFVEFTFVQLNLNSPEVDNAEVVAELPSGAIAPVDFDACPSDRNLTNQSQPEPINTSIGKIYPARGIIVQGDKIILTPYPTPNIAPRNPVQLNNC